MATKSKHVQNNWTPEETKILTKNWLGGKDAKEIESLLTGRTRTAIWSRVKTLKLKRDKPTFKRLTHVSSFKELERGVKRKVVPYVDPPFIGGKLLADLTPMECRYPFKGQIYCGKPSNRAYAYCSEHHALCYRHVKCS